MPNSNSCWFQTQFFHFLHTLTQISPWQQLPSGTCPCSSFVTSPKAWKRSPFARSWGAWWAAAGASTGGDKERGSYLAGVSSDPKNNENIQKSIELPGQITRNMGQHANLEFPRLPDEGNICKKPWLWLGFDGLNMKRGSEMNLFSAGWGLHVQNVPWSRICPAKTDVRT